MAKRSGVPADVAPTPPSEEELAALLGAAHPLLAKMTQGGRIAEWRQYTKRSPWVLRVSQAGKPVIYLQPERGALKATVLLGPRAVAAALAGRVAARLHKAIEEAKVYPEGRPVVLRVKRPPDVTRIEELVSVKLHPELPQARSSRVGPRR